MIITTKSEGKNEKTAEEFIKMQKETDWFLHQELRRCLVNGKEKGLAWLHVKYTMEHVPFVSVFKIRHYIADL